VGVGKETGLAVAKRVAVGCTGSGVAVDVDSTGGLVLVGGTGDGDSVGVTGFIAVG